MGGGVGTLGSERVRTERGERTRTKIWSMRTNMESKDKDFESED